MNAVNASGIGQRNHIARLWPRIVVPLVLCLVCADALAQSEEGVLLAQAGIPGVDDRSRTPQMSVTATSLPRFENTDGSTRTSRLDMALLPPGRSSLGLAMGVTTLQGPSTAMSGPPIPGTSTVDFGLHWRYTPDSSNRVDVTAWKRMPQPDAVSLIQNREPTYGARVEMRVAPVMKNGFVAEHGFLGVQLESGARITLRKKEGRPMVYYRSRF